MIRQLNNFYVKNGRTILVLFIIFSVPVFGYYLPNQERRLDDKSEIQFLSPVKWKSFNTYNYKDDYIEVLTKFEENGSFRFFKSFFLVDFIWSFLLCGVIYIYTIAFSGKRKPLYWSLTILFLAWILDAIEGVSYFFDWEMGIIYMEYLSNLKLLFYFLAVALLAYNLVRYFFKSKLDKRDA